MDAGQDEELNEAALEQQIQDHLKEQSASLTAISEALVCDPENQELLEVHEELSAALKSAEESLLQLKRSRLLHEIDLVLDAKTTESSVGSKPVSDDLSVRAESSLLAGSKCRFRHANGRWYYGQILEADREGFARVSFLTPTTEKMQMCKFYMQQRCRFGETCRMSHGILVPLDALKTYDLLKWLQPCAGSEVLACTSLNGAGLWRQAELESWDESLQCGTAVFIHDGSRLEVGIENLSFSEYAQDSEEESTSSDEEEELAEEDEDENDDGFLGLGVLRAAEGGPQLDTRIFAKWEKHTRGVASKMMANMGYREGMGLGKTGQGIVIPLQVKVLPKHQSLDFISKGDDVDQEKGKKKKKKSRGGKRKRDRKLADAARAAKAQESKRPDVFGFINKQLAGQVEGDEREGSTRFESEKVKSERQVKAGTHKEDRKSLMAQADEIVELRCKVEKLQEMAVRNRKDKAFHEAISRRLQDARKELLNAESRHASTSLAVQSKDKEKRWLKF